MTVDTIETPALAKRAQAATQASAIEQQRAIAEVQAAVVVAQQCPRSIPTAVEAMQETTSHIELASRAFFEYRRGTSNITGPSIHLARELARIWGNLDYGIKELRRDDVKGESEMLAFAWDQQTNTRPSISFIVPHEMDTKQGRKKLVDLRDVYENNTNQGARRVREMVFAVLPAWFVEDAKRRCLETIANANTDPMPKQVADALAAFSQMGVSAEQVVAKVGKPQADWTPMDLAQLRVTYDSIVAREIQRDEAFPPVEGQAAAAKTKVTADEITGAQGGQGDTVGPDAAQAGQGGSSEGGDPRTPSGVTQPSESPFLNPQSRLGIAMFAALGDAGITEKGERLEFCSASIGRTIASSKEMTDAEAVRVIESCKNLIAMESAPADGDPDISVNDPALDGA